MLCLCAVCCVCVCVCVCVCCVCVCVCVTLLHYLYRYVSLIVSLPMARAGSFPFEHSDFGFDSSEGLARCVLLHGSSRGKGNRNTFLALLIC
jgi:hypothetical protein